ARSTQRDGQSRSVTRSSRSRYEQGKRARLTWTKADAKESVGPDRRTFPGQPEGQRQDHEPCPLWCIRGTGGRCGRVDSCLGTFLDETNHAAIGYFKCG